MLIDSLQILRCFCCLLVIINHSCVLVNIQIARFAVTTFFILSSFLFSIKENINNEVSIKNNLKFSLKRINKIYPLHLLCTFAMIPLFLYGTYVSKVMDYSLFELFFCFLSHVTLTQSLIPNNQNMLPIQIYNSISWYLSTSLFCNFIYPFFKYLKSFFKNIKRIIIACFCIYLVYFVLISCANSSLFNNKNIIYLFYFSPIIRIFDCLIGYFLGKIYIILKNNNIAYINFFTFLSLLSVLLLFLLQYNNYFQSIFEYDFIYIPISCFLIICFALNNNNIMQLKSSKLFSKIGNLSGYMYLLAGVIMDYSKNIYQFLFREQINKYILIVFVFSTSYFLAKLYKTLLDMFIKKKTI